MRNSKPERRGESWRIRWTDENGERQTESHPNKRDAELALRRHHVEVEERKRGLRKLRPLDVTLATVAKAWIETIGFKKRSKDTDESFLRVHLLPAFGAVRISDINQDVVDGYLKERDDLAKTTLHHHVTLLITLLRFAKRKGWLAEFPDIAKPRLVLDEADFSYLRNEAEVARFLDSARKEGAFVFMLYAIPIYTGLRLGEVCGLERPDVDLDLRLLHVRHSYRGPTKSARSRNVPILDPLLPHLRAWLDVSGSDLLFGSETGRVLRRDSPYFKRDRHFGRTLERGGFNREYITYHDLRHYSARPITPRPSLESSWTAIAAEFEARGDAE